MSANEIRKSSPAFTLIEVMLALGVSAIVLAAIGGVFFSAMRLRERTVAALDEIAPVNQALWFMRRDLRGVLPPGGVLAGDFKDGAVNDTTGTGFGLQFCTTTGAMSDSAPWGDVQQIIYELRDSGQGAGRAGKNLVRNITRNLLASTVVDSEEQIILGNVQSLQFSCYDGLDWRDNWDTSLSDTNLPSAVRVRIQLADTSGAETRRQEPIELIVPLVTQTRVTQSQSSDATQ